MSNVIFNAIPTSMEEFQALPQATMSTPDDTAALAILAYSVYPSNKELSLQMLDFLRGPRPLSGMDKQFIRDRFMDKDYVPRSYFAGATPDNEYTPNKPYSLTFFENNYSRTEEGFVKLLVNSGGADSPRSLKMRLAKDGKWYLWDDAGILSGIRVPASADPWA